MPKEGFKYQDVSKEHFCGLGFLNPKLQQNVGVAFRSAVAMGIVDFLFTVGDRYSRPHSDVINSWRQVPLFNFKDVKDLLDHMPMACELVGVELTNEAVPIQSFKHPQRAVYLMGAEDEGLPATALKHCRHVVKLPDNGGTSLNLSVAASVVLYDKWLKQQNGVTNQ